MDHAPTVDASYDLDLGMRSLIYRLSQAGFATERLQMMIR
jgi:hypothetical protein